MHHLNYRPSNMFRITQGRSLRYLSQQIFQNTRWQSSAPSAASTQKWDLYAGVLVERLPVISKTLNPIERQFQDLLWRIEYENSLKSNHELQHERDLVQMELIKKGKIEVDLDDTTSKQTAQDLKDAYTEELKKFQFAPRTTQDDTSNKLTSTDRCLEDTLYLLVQQKIGEQEYFLLPQGVRQEGESMRQTAERVLRERCGEQVKVQFYGQAPVGFYKYKYPSAKRSNSLGAKVFFYRASLLGGQVDQKVATKFEWLTKEALNGKVKNPSYADSVNKFLY